ncbi:hypothetical protein ABZ769_28140 [Streptomyces olivoreticuli]
MADDLYERYMKAAKAYHVHVESCAVCSPGRMCRTGAALYESFSRLQDAYNNRH